MGCASWKKVPGPRRALSVLLRGRYSHWDVRRDSSRRTTMRTALRLSLAAVALLGSAALAGAADESPPNTLTEKEKADGWKLLFDGKTTHGWHAFRGKDVLNKWKVIDGALVVSPKNGKNGGDIPTDGQLHDLGLSLQRQVTPRAN